MNGPDKLKEFGLWLSQKREACGYSSQRQLAIKSGISPATISRIEAGTQKAEPSTLAKLAPYLGMTYEELMVKAGYLPDDPPIPDLEEGPPSDLDLEKILLESNVMFNGEPLDEEDKQDIIEFLKVAWKTIRKKKRK